MLNITHKIVDLGWLALKKLCASPKPAANKYQASAWSPKQTQEFELYPQASPLAEWLYVPSGRQMNVGSNPAVGAGFFLARKTGVCYGYGAGVALGSQTEHSCLVHLIITPCILCLPYAREPEARPLGWLALKNYVLLWDAKLSH